MSTLSVGTLENVLAGAPPVVRDANGVEIGTFCRAWVNFNGTGTVAIRASFNVSGITDHGTGEYSVNFINAMPDENYAPIGYGGETAAALNQRTISRTSTGYRFFTSTVGSGSTLDIAAVFCAVFR
jgi:hypothetical protein